MKTLFSKKLGDIAEESSQLVEKNERLLSRQKQLTKVLLRCPHRLHCILCESGLDGAKTFKHREIDYAICSVCGHIQTTKQPGKDYPFDEEGGIKFEEIYPELSQTEYISRKNRIYRPKVDWALSCHEDVGMEREEMVGARWLELGCGCGYLLSALRDVGVQNIRGPDGNKELVRRANAVLGDDTVDHYTGSLASAVANYSADIYVAIFVLEHIEDARRFFEALSQQPRGTVLVFSVPTFGFSTILESSFKHYSARNLDSLVHTQLYTESSLRYCLKLAGFEMAAQWIFGQDASDLSRLLLLSLKGKYPEFLLRFVKETLIKVQDPIQKVLDKNLLADSRHVLAIKG